MEQYFIEFMTTGAGGTAVLVILGAAVALGTLYKAVISPILKRWKESIEADHRREESTKELQDDLKKCISSVTDVQKAQSETQEMISQYDKKLNDIVRDLESTRSHTDDTRDQLLEIVENQNKSIQELQTGQQKLSEQVDILIASDKEDIKSFIMKEYQYWAFQRGEIDPYSLGSIEARYQSYRKEHGDERVLGDLVDELRKLKKAPAHFSHYDSENYDDRYHG